MIWPPKITSLSIALLTSITTLAATPPQEEADRILGAAGIAGGVVVHLGCDNGSLTVALARSEQLLVQGLDHDRHIVHVARQEILNANTPGRASVRLLRGRRLPYVDNSCNLLIVSKPLGVPRSEWMRVLAPLGVLMIHDGGNWQRQTKPWPSDIDEWTHFLHSPDNNAVAQDSVVGPPRQLQWVADPRHLRSHEHLNSLSALVSSQGRVFYVIDEGPVSSAVAPPRWRLVVRDAFNGKLLWKQDLGKWEGHFRLFRSGPPEMGRRLVADGNRVYVTDSYGGHVVAYDAVTGDAVRTFEDTKGAVEILCNDGRLYVLTGTIDPHQWQAAAARYYPTPAARDKAVVSVDAETGRTRWRRADMDTFEVLPTTMAVSVGHVFLQNTRQVVCLDADSGDVKWRADRPVYTTRLSWSTPTLVVRNNVVLSADGSTGGVTPNVRRGEDRVTWIMSDQDIRQHPGGDMVAFSAETGEPLWTGKSLQNFCSPGDLFVFGDNVLAGGNVAPRQMELNTMVNLLNGEVTSSTQDLPPSGGHTRCYRNKATERFLLLGSSGVEFVDLKDWSWTANLWVRGTCQYGIMPCNGLLYVPPDSCACRANVRLHGFTAMAPASSQNADDDIEERGDALEMGAAFDQVQIVETSGEATALWPTYRHDNARSGATKASIDAQVKLAWEAPLGGKLSSVTVGRDTLFVSQIDTHTIYALDLDSGKRNWQFTVGASVDSPPTLAGDLVVLGSRDGWVYCLRCGDGELVWRYRAAPEDRFLLAQEHLESVWPVHGSVLIRDEHVWCVAGRSSYLDGGLRLLALDLETGQPIVDQRLDGRNVETWASTRTTRNQAVRNRLPGTLPDILSTDGELLFMGWTAFDAQGNVSSSLVPHLFSSTGFLDDTWWHRTYWQYGTWMRGGFGGWPQAARQTTAGRLLVVGGDTVYGFGREKFDAGNPNAVHAGHTGLIKDTYQDSGRVDRKANPQRLYAAAKPPAEVTTKRAARANQYHWQVRVPIVTRAMVLANQTLWIAGPKVKKDNLALAQVGTVQPAQLIAVSAKEGAGKAAHDLAAPPVLDGMAAVDGRIVISCADGTVRCFAE